MRFLRWLWQGVLAFDRVGSRVPQLIQTWLIELFFVMPLAFFIGKAIDIRGAFGVPGTGEPMPGVFWGALAVSVLAGFFVIKSIVRPRIAEGSWAPVTTADIGGLHVAAVNNRWRVDYTYLTSHPSYGLLCLLTAPIPAVMVLASIDEGDSTFYFRVTGIVGLVLLALLASFRLLTFYVLRLGRRDLRSHARDIAMSERRIGWEMAWKPVLMLMVLVYAVVALPLGYMWWQEQRTIAALPVITVEDAVADTYYLVEGTVTGEPVYWAPRGTGRGGNNYAGAGVVVQLDNAAGEVLLLAESLSVSDFRGVLRHVENGRINVSAKVIDTITDTQRQYYGFQLDDFPAASHGRVLALLSYP